MKRGRQNFHRIQDAAEERRIGTRSQEHADACFYHAFHDLRRAFATMNADWLTRRRGANPYATSGLPDEQRRLVMARQMKLAMQNLYVPDMDAAKKPSQERA